MMKIFNTNRGFTLVEAMIAVGLFSVIMTIGIGAILAVNSTHKKTQSMRVAIDSLSFLMEDMARSMRLGDYFVCKQSTLDPIGDIDVGNPQNNVDGEGCKSISFEPYWQTQISNPDNQIVYFIGEDGNGNGTIFKKDETMTDWNLPMKAVTPSDIDIDIDRSGFTVTGSANGDGVQPRITIVLVGTVTLAGIPTEFNMQTTVSQRLLDIDSFN